MGFIPVPNPFQYEPVSRGRGPRQIPVVGGIEDDYPIPGLSQGRNIVGCVLDIEVRSYLRLITEEADVSVGDSVPV